MKLYHMKNNSGISKFSEEHISKNDNGSLRYHQKNQSYILIKTKECGSDFAEIAKNSSNGSNRALMD